jgi:hypothetical protein
VLRRFKVCCNSVGVTGPGRESYVGFWEGFYVGVVFGFGWSLMMGLGR